MFLKFRLGNEFCKLVGLGIILVVIRKGKHTMLPTRGTDASIAPTMGTGIWYIALNLPIRIVSLYIGVLRWNQNLLNYSFSLTFPWPQDLTNVYKMFLMPPFWGGSSVCMQQTNEDQQIVKKDAQFPCAVGTVESFDRAKFRTGRMPL